MPTSDDKIRVSFYNFFHAGGIGRYTYDLLQVLARAPELELELMCTPQFSWQDLPGVSVWPGLTRITHSVPTLRRMRFLLANWTSPQRGIRRAKEVGADILHFSEFNRLTYPFWAGPLRRSGAKVVISVHDVLREKTLVNRAWEDKNLAAFYRHADALLVHSRFQASELRAFSGVPAEKIHIVPHGPYDYGEVEGSTEELREALDLPQGVKLGLLFGQIRDEKNLEGLMEAMRLTQSNVHLLVAGAAGGRHRDAAYYEDYARSLGLTNRVIFRLGFVPDAMVGKYFRAADWVALPYKRSFTSQSGVLNVAAHYERPVLAGTAPVLEEAVRTNDIGEAAGADTPEAIAEGLDRLHRKLVDGYSFPFAPYRARHSWEENARLTLGVYRALVGREVRAARRPKGSEIRP